MNARAGNGDPRIDLYVDGLLDGEQLAVFERELGESAVLREALEAQERIDGELRKMFVYDARRAGEPMGRAAPVEGNRDVIGRIDQTTSQRASAGSGGRLRWYGLAAAVVLCGAAVLSVYVQRRYEIERTLSPGAVYAMVQGPEFVCKDDAEFAEAVRKRLGQPLILAATPGVAALGWAYGDDYNGKIVGDKTMVLINTVDGEKVLVFMDRLRDDRKLDAAPLPDGLKLFRREVGSLVLYEVTPLARPRVIESLVVPGEK